MTGNGDKQAQAKTVRLGAPADTSFRGRDILSVKQFSRTDLERIFLVARNMRTAVETVGSIDLLKGRLLTAAFYEPSTRTSSSFQAAMKRLGGEVIALSGMAYSSVAKGETLEDTMRTLEAYSDVLVLRHPEKGSAARAARVTRCPVINAGDGPGEHPTQALLDMFTIEQELGRFDGIRVAMVGDLRYGRTVHSLSRLLTHFDVTLDLVSPELLRMPAHIVQELRDAGMTVNETADLESVLPHADVLYCTRVQKERFEDPSDYAKVKGAYIFDPDVMGRAKADAVLMHPFPRVDEITPAVDSDPRAAYFRQIEYGLYVRMALLAMVLGQA